jgi:hypothetical protein
LRRGRALEHLLRAAAALTNERDFIAIGSRAVLGQFPRAPDALLASIEADLYPRDAIEESDLIDGAIGELSQFHETFGYYAHGVDVPAGWQGASRTPAQRTHRRGDRAGASTYTISPARSWWPLASVTGVRPRAAAGAHGRPRDPGATGA